MFKLASVQFLWGNPHVAAIFDELGVDANRGYFALRAAPMGRATPLLIGNAFAFFPPAMVAKLVQRSWDRNPPERVLAVAVPHLAEAARSVFGSLEDVVELADRMGEAAEAAWCEGRMLATAWRTVSWPDEPAARLFGAATVLREHRGDGHILALAEHGLSPLQGMLLAAARRGKDPVAVATTRGWRPDDVAAARAGLEARGALDDDGITATGRDLWEWAETTTDRLAAQPWGVLGDAVEDVVAAAGRLIETARW